MSGAKGLKLILAFLTISLAPALESQAEEVKWVACKKLGSVGLFEQCEEVLVLKHIGERVQAYSFTSKKRLNVKDEEVFEKLSADSIKKISKGQQLLIPGPLIWSGSSEKVQTLCRSLESTQDNIVSLDCGGVSSKRANKNLIYYLGRSFKDATPSAPSIGQAKANKQAALR